MYRIFCQFYYFPGTYNALHDGWLVNHRGEPIEFKTYDEVVSYVGRIEMMRYDLSHGEYARPDLTIWIQHDKGWSRVVGSPVSMSL